MVITLLRTVRSTFDFKGRSSRKELFLYLVFISGLYGLVLSIEQYGLVAWFEKGALIRAGLGLCALPVAALVVRRVHDIGCSAGVMLAWLVPFSGMVIQAWMLLSKGDPEENHYGLPPRY